jgi:hypothetical protein
MDIANDMVIDVDGGNLDVKDAGAMLLNISATQVSGSSISTGSFGRLESTTISGDGSGIINLTPIADGPEVGTVYIHGKLGIGVNDPTDEIEVNDGNIKITSGGTDRITLSGDSSSPLIKLERSGGAKVMLRSIGDSYFTGGNVGIGTNGPGTLLHVSSSNYGNALYVSGSGGNPLVGIGTTSPGAALEVIGDISGSATSTGSFGTVQVNGQHLYGNSTGIGIGTVSPGQKLEVSGNIKLASNSNNLYLGDNSYMNANGAAFVMKKANTGDFEMKLSSSSTDGVRLHFLPAGNDKAYIGYSTSNLLLQLWANSSAGIALSPGNSEKVRITTSGNVGIGTTVPTEKLTVAGDISASGDFHGLSGTLTLGGNISGSSTSTGSFGHLIGDGSGLTGVAQDIDLLSAYGAATLHQTQDLFHLSDNGTEKSITFSNLEDSVFANVSGDIAIAAGGAATIQANSVALSTDTTGNYVGTITGGTGITSTAATSGEGTTHSLSVDASQTQITSVGALDAGSITSNFGSIVNGASAITTTGTVSAGTLSVSGNATVDGNLDVNGTVTTIQSTNLLVKDRFILMNSGSAAGDGGIIVQTEGTASGSAFVYDDNITRWGFQQGTKLAQDAATSTPDAYAAAVVTSDDANYRKNGNIRVQSGEIYIYIE